MTKCFFLQEKQKQNKKHITRYTILQNEQGKFLKTNSKILKQCNFFHTLYTKQNTSEKIQNELLQDI